MIRSLEQRFESKSPSHVTKVLVPIGVRLATTLIAKTELQDDQINEETSSIISDNQTLYNFDYSSSSDLNLSPVFDLSSLHLSSLDNEQVDETTSLSLTQSQLTSDNESVLYLRLTDELDVHQATLESDLERLD